VQELEKAQQVELNRIGARDGREVRERIRYAIGIEGSVPGKTSRRGVRNGTPRGATTMLAAPEW
jgi:hypothetical protein